MAGLAERDLGCPFGIREVVEAFVEDSDSEVVGETMFNDEVDDALEALRPRRTMSLGPARFEGEESLRLRG